MENLEEYLSNGVEGIVKEIMKASLRNPKESAFLAQYVWSSRKARQIRKEQEKAGNHIPTFLIASITTKCNLRCVGCYARANHSCQDVTVEDKELLGVNRWSEIFKEAQELGVGFILLAGGEPFLRMDVLKEAAKHKKILFPVFTNGMLLGKENIDFLNKNRNLIPVLSIEGNEEKTDRRRGSGTYQKLVCSMENLKRNDILFAASVTVTRENRNEVLSEKYARNLYEMGCRGIIYVEYVPADQNAEVHALSDRERNEMMEQISLIRQMREDMIFLAFPGDEKSSGGCLAAGRGFFHINAHGGAEPCPFSPYSDVNLKNVSLMDALHSKLFRTLQENKFLEKEHIGGCTLFAQRKEVEKLLNLKGEAAEAPVL